MNIQKTLIPLQAEKIIVPLVARWSEVDAALLIETGTFQDFEVRVCVMGKALVLQVARQEERDKNLEPLMFTLVPDVSTVFTLIEALPYDFKLSEDTEKMNTALIELSQKERTWTVAQLVAGVLVGEFEQYKNNPEMVNQLNQQAGILIELLRDVVPPMAEEPDIKEAEDNAE